MQAESNKKVVILINELTEFVNKMKKRKELSKENDRHPIISSDISKEGKLDRMSSERDEIKKEVEKLRKEKSDLEEIIRKLRESIKQIYAATDNL